MPNLTKVKSKIGQPPKVEMPPIETGSMLRDMALLHISQVLKRAFNQGKRAKDVDGKAVRPLSAGYRAYKSGKVKYGSKRARKAAKTRRSQTSYGKGPLVRTEGGAQKRLGPRSSQADQRLSDGTMKALGITRVGKTLVAMGFRTARSRRVAGALNARNRFWGFTKRERKNVLALSDKAADRAASNVNLENGTIVVEIPLGGKKSS